MLVKRLTKGSNYKRLSVQKNAFKEQKYFLEIIKLNMNFLYRPRRHVIVLRLYLI